LDAVGLVMERASTSSLQKKMWFQSLHTFTLCTSTQP